MRNMLWSACGVFRQSTTFVAGTTLGFSWADSGRRDIDAREVRPLVFRAPPIAHLALARGTSSVGNARRVGAASAPSNVDVGDGYLLPIIPSGSTESWNRGEESRALRCTL